MIKLFGSDRTRIGDSDTEWAVWVSGPDDIHNQPDLEHALITAAEFNATARETYDGSQFSPVIYAVVLHWGYAWARDVEHTTGGNCGVDGCAHCDRPNAPELKPVSTDAWANVLATAGLEAGPALGYRLASGPYELAVHIATSNDIDPATRRQLVDAVQKRVSDAVHRVLGRLPVTVWRQHADGTSVTVSEATR
ncbi:hypothetical protein [Streptomyces turgidiscabies]|uniref:hypothetical protein n=1 Tax=Streptomyces turgidiscabies TaxID=85558 RepID=UPI0038F5D3A1